MARKAPRTPLVLFGLLAVYILVQFTWWAYLLLAKDRTVVELKQRLRAEGIADLAPSAGEGHAFWMVLGEGSVFLVLVILGLWITFRTLKQELALAKQQEDFLLATSHELRTPIAGLKLHLRTLQRSGLSEEQRAALQDTALVEADRLGTLTEKILLATRLGEALPTPELVAFDAAGELRELLRVASLTYGKGHTLHVQPEGSLELRTDRAAFRSVATNLLENACKYAPAGTTVRLELLRTNAGTELQVIDAGPGIAPADAQRIFEKFYRSGNEATRDTKGTGLGLYIVQRLMRGLGGRIEHRAAAPRGSIFAATFPQR
ncbi:MAG TPA: ATP-binding protein [Flavobacteriales bacterium]|jgi:signal transduction histidine kinase|nr:ATP-binding protein [Flavobacteriales bacterium]